MSHVWETKQKAFAQGAAQAGWILGAPRHSSPARGRMGNQDFPSTCFSQLWRDWEGTEELLLPGSQGVCLGIFVLSRLVSMTQKGIEEEIWLMLRKEGSKPAGRNRRRAGGRERMLQENRQKSVWKRCWRWPRPAPGTEQDPLLPSPNRLQGYSM